jgi:hypothetical protein
MRSKELIQVKEPFSWIIVIIFVALICRDRE